MFLYLLDFTNDSLIVIHQYFAISHIFLNLTDINTFLQCSPFKIPSTYFPKLSLYSIGADFCASKVGISSFGSSYFFELIIGYYSVISHMNFPVLFLTLINAFF